MIFDLIDFLTKSIIDQIWSLIEKIETATNIMNSNVSPRLAIHLSWNMQKWVRNAKKERCIAGYFVSLYSLFTPLFSHFVPGSAFTRKVKGFRGSFFHGINKTWNSYEMRKVYSECFVFCGVFFAKILAKCKMRKVHR